MTMWKTNHAVSLEYRGGRVFRVRFDDGLEGDVDFSRYVGSGPVFEPLADMEFFRKARIEFGTIAWPNGADIAPETLYEMVEAAVRGRRAPKSRKSRAVVTREMRKDAPPPVRKKRE